jgi:hypothetical protein
MSPGKPQDTTLVTDAERSDASRRDADPEHETKPRNASGRDMARCWQTDEQHHDANRCDADIRKYI